MSGRRALTARAVVLGATLSVVYTVVNTYLNVNFGMGFGYTTITILLAYGLFHKLGRGSSRTEISACTLAAGMALPIGWTTAFIIYASENLGGLDLPWWLAPPGLGQGSDVPFSAWAVPLAVLFVIAALSTATGIIVAYAVQPLIDRSERMVFPFYRAPATIIDACFEEGGRRLRTIAYFMAIGLAITGLQYALEALGVPAVLIDLSPYLPKGFILGIYLSVVFVACGLMIGPAVSFSMLASSLITYALVVPLLVSRGLLAPVKEPMEFYRDAVMKFLISPALGMMLLGGLLTTAIRSLASKIRAEKEARREGQTEVKGVGYGELLSYFFRSLKANKKLLAAYLAVIASVGLLAFFLNPLRPLSPLISVVVALLSATLLMLLDYAVLVKMAGEVGMTMGTHEFWLYAAPILATGYKGYTPYIIMPGEGSHGAWEGVLLSGYGKVRRELGLEFKDIVKARLVTWLPSFTASAGFILLAWRLWGLGSPQMPCVSVMLSLPLVRMVAERRIKGIIDPWTFLIGAFSGAVLEALTPISLMGLAMGLVLLPYYSVPFAMGGALRILLDRKMGRDWFGREGMAIASALIASSVLVQVAFLALMALAG